MMRSSSIWGIPELSIADKFAGTYTALLPIGMFQMLLVANGCFKGSRAVGVGVGIGAGAGAGALCTLSLNTRNSNNEYPH